MSVVFIDRLSGSVTKPIVVYVRLLLSGALLHGKQYVFSDALFLPDGRAKRILKLIPAANQLQEKIFI